MVALSSSPQPSIMSDSVRVQHLSLDSVYLPKLATLHAHCLPSTLTSNRGVKTIEGLYRLLLTHNHAIYAALNGDDVVGGLVVTKAGVQSPTTLLVLHRPWSWLRALGRLGPASFLNQVSDLAALHKQTGRYQPHDYITALYISEQYRRTGVATALLHRCSAEAVSSNVGLGVDTSIRNEPALRLYQSHGFTERFRTRISVMLTQNVG